MNINSLIEMGSKANVILRFKADVTIGGFTYLANEPYLFLKDVNVIINYENQDKSISAAQTQIANSYIYPKTVSIGSVNFTRKVCSLLTTYEESVVEYSKTNIKSYTAEKEDGEPNGIIFLSGEIDIARGLFVYDSDFQKVAYTYNESLNALLSPDFEDETQYLISYSSVEPGTRFKLNKPCLPYMSLEIQGTGNIDKKTNKILLYLDKVSLSSMFEFNFIQDEIISVPLVFNIIKGEDYLIFGD